MASHLMNWGTAAGGASKGSEHPLQMQRWSFYYATIFSGKKGIQFLLLLLTSSGQV
jgi:hypothetical protein